MNLRDVVQWLVLASMILAGGMWLGQLQQQVTDMKGVSVYLNGNVKVPVAAPK